MNTGEKEIVRKLTDCINDERSLVKLVDKFLSSNKEDHGGDTDEDEDTYDNSTDEEEDACNNLNTEL